jgi:hypothetical protein
VRVSDFAGRSLDVFLDLFDGSTVAIIISNDMVEFKRGRGVHLDESTSMDGRDE